MSPEETVYKSNSDEGGQGRMAKLVVKQVEWHSDELTRELKSLVRKANRTRSERGKRMMVKRGGRKFCGKQPPLPSKVCARLGFKC